MVSERAATKLAPDAFLDDRIGRNETGTPLPRIRRTRYPAPKPGRRGGGPPRRPPIAPRPSRALREIARRGLSRAGMPYARALLPLVGPQPGDYIDGIGDLLRRPDAMPGPRRHNGSWYLEGQCTPKGNNSLGEVTAYSAISTCINSLNTNPPNHQGLPVGWQLGAGQASNVRAHWCWYQPHGNPSLSTRRSALVWRTTVGPSRAAQSYMSPEPWSNPNVLRRTLTLPQVIKPHMFPEADPFEEIPELQEMELRYPVDATSRAFGRAGQRVGRARIAPPPTRTKERKFRSKSLYYVALLFKILDDVSELSELVSAFYDALPKYIRKQYDQPPRGMLDAAGQYGIDGADWKLVAIYENFDKVNVPLAVENIVNNHLQDAMLGAIQANTPHGAGMANGDAFRGINELFQEGWDLTREGFVGVRR